VAAKFERAQKLYVLAWLDPNLIKAGELNALTALELALRDRYTGRERARRRKLVAKMAESEKRPSFAHLLKFMVECDGLTDDQMPMNRRCGPTCRVIGLLTGEAEPGEVDPTSFAGIRNDLAHGAPLGGFPWAGFLELVRDLIETLTGTGF